MGLDIRQTVADRAKKWQQLSQLLEDREIYVFLKNRFSGNGRRDSSPALDFGQQESKPVAYDPKPIGEPDTASETKLRKGDLTKAVEAECLSFDIGERFSAYAVQERMAQNGFSFASSNPGVAVALIMRKMADRGRIIREAQKGGGKRATTYERNDV